MFFLLYVRPYVPLLSHCDLPQVLQWIAKLHAKPQCLLCLLVIVLIQRCAGKPLSLHDHETSQPPWKEYALTVYSGSVLGLFLIMRCGT